MNQNDAPHRAARKRFAQVLEHALSNPRVGLERSRRAVQTLLEALRPGDNPKRAAVRSPKAMPPSTFTDYCRDVNLQGFLYRMRNLFRQAAVKALRDFPPDNGFTMAVLDGHQTEYHYEPAKHKRNCRQPACRCKFKTLSHSQNKRSHWAHEWFALSLFWWHRGRAFSVPVLFQPILAFGMRPAVQIRECGRVLRSLRIRPALLLVDRYYDARDCRTTAAKYGFRLGQRLRLERERNRMFIDVETKEAFTLAQFEKDVRHHGEVISWHDGKTGKARARRTLTRRVRFMKEDGEYDLTVSMAVFGKREVLPRWGASKTPIVLATPVGMGPQAKRLYARRWSIETFFYEVKLDEPKPRPKRIYTLVIQSVAFVYLRGLALTLRHVHRLTFAETDPTWARLVTVIEHTRWILDPGDAPD